jgi:uncharacterized protein YjlB
MIKDWRFVHSKSSRAEWTPGLRKIFAYRDLGVEDATKGDYVAHVIRANGTSDPDDVQQWHRHDCSFQLVYVLNGWAVFEYEGQGTSRHEKGDCILQTPLLKHRQLECSDDYEVLEIVAPADFTTEIVDPPPGAAR